MQNALHTLSRNNFFITGMTHKFCENVWLNIFADIKIYYSLILYHIFIYQLW